MILLFASAAGGITFTPLLAAVGCGVFRDYGEAVSRTIRITRVQEPNRANHEKYQKYMALYLKLYEDLKADFPLFQ